MLGSIIFLYKTYYTLDLFQLIFNLNIPLNSDSSDMQIEGGEGWKKIRMIILLGFVLSFAVKIPLFPFHI